MPKATLIVSQFHNLPVREIVDQLGGVKAAIADLQNREKALRDELLSRAVEQIEGAQFGGQWGYLPSTRMMAHQSPGEMSSPGIKNAARLRPSGAGCDWVLGLHQLAWPSKSPDTTAPMAAYCAISCMKPLTRPLRLLDWIMASAIQARALSISS